MIYWSFAGVLMFKGRFRRSSYDLWSFARVLSHSVDSDIILWGDDE